MTDEVEQLVENYGVEEIITILSPLLTEERKEKIQQMVENRLHSIQLGVENPHDIHNALAMIRTSEALGVNNLHIIDPNLRRNRGKGTVKGSSRWTHVAFHQTLPPFLEKASRNQISLYGACVRGTHTLDELPVDRPFCLLFGNEHEGLSKEAIDACTLTYKIPMYGMTESFNLSVSAAISLYTLVRKKRELLGAPSDLSLQKQRQEMAWAFIKTIGSKRAKTIFTSHLV